jgi:hypothetical protein
MGSPAATVGDPSQLLYIDMDQLTRVVAFVAAYHPSGWGIYGIESTQPATA